MTDLVIGLSPCPNDTYAWFGLITGRVRLGSRRLRFEFHDVQAQNERLMSGALSIAKGSFALLPRLVKSHHVLAAGSALGFGVGPLLLSRPKRGPSDPGPKLDASASVLLPGAATTAALLYQVLMGGVGRTEHVVFSEILPALRDGRADFGVCIHEGRFVYPQYSVDLVCDLGATWEARVGEPVPLGGIFASRLVPVSDLVELVHALRQSQEVAAANPGEALSLMREHAQELSDEAIWQHVHLYVNDYTRNIGDPGRRALGSLLALSGQDSRDLSIIG
jgi:1,4-dihydroxy-6-naphthoate synthase